MGRRCASTTGRPSYPFLTLFSSLFLGIWYKNSDEYLAASLTRDLLFRRFCRFKLSGDIPDATTLGCFANDLWESWTVNWSGVTGSAQGWGRRASYITTRPIVLRRPERRWPYLVLPIACNEKARGPPCWWEISNAISKTLSSAAERPFATYKRLYGLARTRVMNASCHTNTIRFNLCGCLVQLTTQNQSRDNSSSVSAAIKWYRTWRTGTLLRSLVESAFQRGLEV